MPEAGVAHYYDRLHRWNGVAGLFGYGGGRDALTVHRRLADPAANGAPTTTRVHDILLAYVPAAHQRPDQPGSTRPALRVLDAGCGLGGTMLALADRFNGRFIGLTLSPEQATVANHAAAARGLSASVAAIVRSYDAPPAGPFDLVVAIESLAHSVAPATSVAGLAAVLAPGGRLIVIDDMPEPDATGSADFATFTRGWQSPHLCSAAVYRSTFAALGLTIVGDVDLTDDTRPRRLAQIARLMWLNRIASAVPLAAWRQVMRSHLGGLALERLTRQRLVRYRLLAAERPLNLLQPRS